MDQACSSKGKRVCHCGFRSHHSRLSRRLCLSWAQSNRFLQRMTRRRDVLQNCVGFPCPLRCGWDGNPIGRLYQQWPMAKHK
ncbi:hypothetical protein PENTCL1PPCAC_20576 [Pristionchus entomophagus]|uniref:Ribosomal protein n=1 Tax=Pristionchus entomophagus TaxID=358040 RepID=A0AAV5TVD6_9BILA|nr:hypothetical protein PENTCL1PPCAC_20576 [Pristionchus entomophagus]